MVGSRGTVAVCSLPVTTAVTCPTIRVHPALVAQAAPLPAPSARGPLPPGCRLRGGAERAHPRKPWPTADVRLEMLEEAVGLMRDLWAGDFVSHRGRHYTVDTARIYTRTESPPPVYVSAFGPKAVEVAARIGDGYVTTSPDKAMVQAFRSAAGANKPIQEEFKVRSTPIRLTRCHDRALWSWPAGLPGWRRSCRRLAISSRHPRLVTEGMTRSSVVCGKDPRLHIDAFAPFVEAGFDEISQRNMGPRFADMIAMYGNDVLPGAQPLRAEARPAEMPGIVRRPK